MLRTPLETSQSGALSSGSNRSTYQYGGDIARVVLIEHWAVDWRDFDLILLLLEPAVVGVLAEVEAPGEARRDRSDTTCEHIMDLSVYII